MAWLWVPSGICKISAHHSANFCDEFVWKKERQENRRINQVSSIQGQRQNQDQYKYKHTHIQDTTRKTKNMDEQHVPHQKHEVHSGAPDELAKMFRTEKIEHFWANIMLIFAQHVTLFEHFLPMF